MTSSSKAAASAAVEYLEDATRDVKIESWRAAVLILNVYVGMDMLSMPMVFQNAGNILSIFIVIFICAANIFSSKRLIKVCNFLNPSKGKTGHSEKTDCNAEESENLVVSYAEISEQLFDGKKAKDIARYSCEVLQSLLQIGICISYVIFIADHLKSLIGFASVRGWIALLLPLFIIESLLNIKVLSYISSLSIFALVAGLIIIFKYLVRKAPDSVDQTEDTNAMLVFLSISQVMFVFSDVPVIIPIQMAMKKPEELKYFFPVILILITIVNIFIGYFGALVFGLSTDDSIMLNFPDAVEFQIVRLMFALMTFFTFPVNLYPVVEIFRERLELVKKCLNERVYDTLQKKWFLKICFILFTCSVALAFPSLGTMLSLVGAFTGTILALILPPLLHLRMCWVHCQLTKCSLFMDVFVISLGIVFCLAGTYATFYDIIQPGASILDYAHI